MNVFSPSARPRASSGFTLLELMIAVVVVAILVIVAYPSYEEHLRKGRRASAQTFLVDVANREQQYLIDARAYATGANALTTLNIATPADVAKFYIVTIEAVGSGTPPAFNVLATPIAGSSQVKDGVLTLDSAGARTRGGASGW